MMTPSPLLLWGAKVRAHRWWRARARRNQRTIAWESDRAEDRPREPKPVTSDQMREPATELTTVESVMDSEREALPTAPWLGVSN